MVRNRRDVLCATFLFALIFAGGGGGGGVTGKPGSAPEFAHQLRENAKWGRSNISGGLKWLRDWRGVVKLTFLTASLIMVYWEMSGWVVRYRFKTVTSTDQPPSVAPSAFRPVETTRPPASASTDEVSLGTGVAGAAHPSAPVAPVDVDDGIAVDQEASLEPNQKRCESPDVTLTGCASGRPAGLKCRGYELGKYFLLEDDGLADQPAQREAFLCARHGEEYIAPIRNKRRNHAWC